MMTIIHVIIVVQKIIVMVGKQDIVVHCVNGMVVGIVTIATQWIFKLIGRLEEKAHQTWLVLAERNGYERAIEIVNQLAEEYKQKSAWQSIYDKVVSLEHEYAENGEEDAVNDCIRLENLLQYFKEELQSTEECSLAGGWIPCSERLPEIDGNTSDVVLVCTVDGFQHMAFWCDDKKWRYCESGMIKNTMEWTEIIAWQPLPAPYIEK